MNPGPSISKALRNKAIIEWLMFPLSNATHPELPGTRNTLLDLASGYASFLGCDLSEVLVAGNEWLCDSDFLDFIAVRYMPTIERWFEPDF